MLSENETREIAFSAIRHTELEVQLDPHGPLHVDDDYVLWVYNTRAFWEGDIMAALAGNGAIVVDRETGEVNFLPTASPWEESLEELRGSRGA